MFGRWRGDTWHAHEDAAHPGLARHLRAADIALVNLETALCDQATARHTAAAVRGQRHRLTAPPERAIRLAEAGVDVAVLANNHALDCGPDSLAGTVRALAAHGIAAVGATPADARAWPVLVVDHPSGRARGRARGELVITAATMHPPPVRPGALAPAVLARSAARDFEEHVRGLARAHPRALRVVSLHWGQEGAVHPGAHQRVLARRLVDAGAHVIHGHGAHVIQDIEHYRGAAIVYSAGNLRFDMRQPNDAVEITLVRDGTWRVAGARPVRRPAPIPATGRAGRAR